MSPREPSRPLETPPASPSTHSFFRAEGGLRIVVNPVIDERTGDIVRDWKASDLKVAAESDPVSTFEIAHVSADSRQPLDVVLALDTSAKQEGLLRQLGPRIPQFVQQLTAIGFDVRLGGIEFADEVRSQVSLGNADSFLTWLAGLTAVGGGDPASSLVDVLSSFDAHFTFRREAARYIVVLNGGGLHESGDSTSCAHHALDEGVHGIRFTSFLGIAYAASSSHTVGVVPSALARAAGGFAFPILPDSVNAVDWILDTRLIDVWRNAYIIDIPQAALPSGVFSGGIEAPIHGDPLFFGYWVTP